MTTVREEKYSEEELEKLQQIKKKGIGNSIRNVRMGERKMTLRDKVESKLGPLSDFGLMESTTKEIMKVILEFIDEEISYIDDKLGQISDVYDLPLHRMWRERRSALRKLRERAEGIEE